MPSPKGRPRAHRRVNGTIFAYVTCIDATQAGAIGRAIVSERLAACANILPGMRSIYWWQGKLDTADEAVLILKTRASLLARLTTRVKSLHTYTVPCVCALPVVGGNPDYLRWLDNETTKATAAAQRRSGKTR